MGGVFEIIKTFVEQNASLLTEEHLTEMLQAVSDTRKSKLNYNAWTACIGAFMARMGGKKFFKVLPLRLIEVDLNSFTYAQDSRSWLITLVAKNLTIDANLEFYATYFLPIILKIDKMRELEQQNVGQTVKVKKYETLLAQLWSLLPQFCQSNSPNMAACFAQILTYLEPIINKNVLSLRPVGLKSFSALINHCLNAENKDAELKKTKKGLTSISMNYIEGLVKLYCQEEELSETQQAQIIKQMLEVAAKGQNP